MCFIQVHGSDVTIQFGYFPQNDTYQEFIIYYELILQYKIFEGQNLQFSRFIQYSKPKCFPMNCVQSNAVYIGDRCKTFSVNANCNEAIQLCFLNILLIDRSCISSTIYPTTLLEYLGYPFQIDGFYLSEHHNWDTGVRMMMYNVTSTIYMTATSMLVLLYV